MRMMLKAHLEVQVANIAMSDGSVEKTIGEVMQYCKPEAAYFCTEGGRRTIYAVFDLAEPSDIVVLAEPLFQNLGAEVEFIPVMVQADLQKGAGIWMSRRS